jgi:zinc resistance-associated protein
MNHSALIKEVAILSAIVLFGLSTPALADRSMGYGHHDEEGLYMHEMHHGGYDGGPGYGYRGDLSAEDLQKLEKERAAFFEATRDLRGKIYQKSLELRSELAKENPDPRKAADLQKEISELQAQFAQKRLAHFFQVRKIIPDVGRGYRGGFSMMGLWGRGGYGMMGGGMMGPRGSYGGGYCPNDRY